MRALADSLLPNCFTLAVLWGPGKAQGDADPSKLWQGSLERGRVCTERCVGGTGMGRLCGVLAGGFSFCWHGVEGGEGSHGVRDSTN